MIEKNIKLPPRQHYPVEPWRFVQKHYSPALLGRDEAIFSTSNGYFGIRGCYEEGEPDVQRGTFISGFHETWHIPYAEDAYGLARTGQTMVTATDASTIKLFVDDEPFSMAHAYLLEFERALDFRKGTLDRSLVWDTASGKQIKIESRRLVSFPERHVAAYEYKVTVLNASAHITLVSEMHCQESEEGDVEDPRNAPKLKHKIFNPEIQKGIQQRLLMGHSITNSKMKIVCGIDHQIRTKNHYTLHRHLEPSFGKMTYTVEAEQGETITLYKFITYHTSSPRPQMQELIDRAEITLDRVLSQGFDYLAGIQEKYLDDFWHSSDIVIDHKDPRVGQTMRLHVFHLLQSAARVQNSGIGAKGLTGSGYEGHSFWDIEVYMLPFLIYNQPRVAKNILIYRYKMLDHARQRAKELNQRGALYPWRTIMGEEASAFFLAGTAQYHINAAICFGIIKYAEITGDKQFLIEYGAEILLETARLWADLGFYGDDYKFHIHGVTGPDEYNTMVNNNTYTNYMARENLIYAARVVEDIRDNHKDDFNALKHRTNLEAEEIEAWKAAAEHMYIPFNEKLGINPQDDNFLLKEKWDLKNTPKDKFPLLLHYHPLVLYRFQVIKQADVVLAMFLLGHKFSDELKKKNFDYYDPLTTGDSSLSVSIQGILAAELDYLDLAVKYFSYALLMDIADIGGNVDHGLHLASMGGIWMCVVYGVAGMRDYHGDLTFNPKAMDINAIEFSLTVRGKLLNVKIAGDSSTTYLLKEGKELTITHRDENLELKEGKPVRKT